LDKCLLTRPSVYLKAMKSTDEKLKAGYFKRLEDQKAQYPNAAALIQFRSKLDPQTLTLESLSKELLQSTMATTTSKFEIGSKKEESALMDLGQSIRNNEVTTCQDLKRELNKFSNLDREKWGFNTSPLAACVWEDNVLSGQWHQNQQY
jgi:hypothetical protein